MTKSIFTCILTAILVMFSISSSFTANAENNGIKGDVDNNGEFNSSDLVILQNWLLGVPEAELSDWKAADLCEDDILNAFDLCQMRRMLSKNEIEIEYTKFIDQFSEGFTDSVFNASTWNDENNDASAVITSIDELWEFLSVYFEYDVVFQYADFYNAQYFESNVLLLNVFYQTCETESYLQITDTSVVDNSLHIHAEWNIPQYCNENINTALLAQVLISRDAYNNLPVIWDITNNSSSNPSNNFKLINVKNVLQKPELPTGCECVSLTILLNHLGYNVDKLTLARNYLPKMDFYWSNGIYYGADFRTTFAGNPESSSSYGCYAPCIVTTANNYFTANGHNSKADNITGTDFDSLLTDYIDNDIPVLIWITSNNLHETKLTSIWTTPAGEKVQWIAYEHCVVLTGYDKDNGLIYVSDPLVGNTSYDYSRIKQRYIDLGQQAVCIDIN